MARKVSGKTEGEARTTAGRGAGGRKRGGKTHPTAGTDVEMQTLPIGDDAPAALGARAENARMLILVHGIGNKPREAVLKCQWDTALFGGRMGDRTRLAYWVNRAYYPVPEEATCATPDRVRVDDDEITTRAIMALAHAEGGVEAERQAVENEIEALAQGDEEKRETLARIAARMMTAETPDDISPPRGSREAKILPFKPLRQFVARKLTRAFLRDVNDFLYVDERRRAMLQSVANRIAAGGGPFVVIGHSLGSMIAYQMLRQLDPKRHQVPLFITIGSPLGIEEVQDVLRDWGGGKLKVPDCVGRWLNVADPRDTVAAPDLSLKNDFGADARIQDLRLDNPESPGNPHSGTGYLQLGAVRDAVSRAVGSSFGQPIAPFVVAGDLVEELENGDVDLRHATLIQLAVDRPDGSGVARDLDEVARSVTEAIHAILDSQKLSPELARIERLRRYLSAELTRLEIEVLRSRFRELKIEGIWRNAPKQAFISRSTHTIQARPANLGYGADGRHIVWAVLDTGIRADHPHFARHANIVAQYDCSEHGPATRLEPGTSAFDELDRNGHGTHVAAIIAGECEVAAPEPRPGGQAPKPRPELYAGMAPACRIYGFKVLGDDGNGRDSSIFKALDEVAEINERAGQLVIHGVNLSLGGNFDPSVFGTGHTPLCQELRRLWRQGVLVCLAAGNEGHTLLRAQSGYIQANMDITIGDPANLEEAIAVGSVHKTNPHTYGISYFSSRGPTADGRRKPDLVAPGERIVSARHDWMRDKDAERPRLGELYVERSGTSMAAPHVSGLLAAFLSLRREFIGYPDRVKQILLGSCIDLERDTYAQGAGLPSLIKMLALH